MGKNESNNNTEPERRGSALVVATAVITLAIGVTAASWAGYLARPVPDAREPSSPAAPQPTPDRVQPSREEGGTRVVLVPVEPVRGPAVAERPALDAPAESAALWAAAEHEHGGQREGHHRQRHHEEREGEDHDD